MTRKNFYTIAMAVIAMMIGVNANAQGYAGRRGMNGRDGGAHMTEAYRGSYNNNRMPETRGNYNHMPDRHDNYNHMPNNHGNAHYDHHAPAPRVDRHGYVPGWEGRVRHENGRWGYYRDNRWYWYDRYFEPNVYFARPLAHFNEYYYMVDGGYIPGWEGRVMYRNGRWGYLRGTDWYWYDRYYEPAYYFGHPVAHFHAHHVPVGAKVVGAVAGAVVLGSLIGALCH